MTDRKLTDIFVVPPISVLDVKQKYWKDRKKYWFDVTFEKCPYYISGSFLFIKRNADQYKVFEKFKVKFNGMSAQDIDSFVKNLPVVRVPATPIGQKPVRTAAQLAAIKKRDEQIEKFKQKYGLPDTATVRDLTKLGDVLVSAQKELLDLALSSHRGLASTDYVVKRALIDNDLDDDSEFSTFIKNSLSKFDSVSYNPKYDGKIIFDFVRDTSDTQPSAERELSYLYVDMPTPDTFANQKDYVAAFQKLLDEKIQEEQKTFDFYSKRSDSAYKKFVKNADETLKALKQIDLGKIEFNPPPPVSIQAPKGVLLRTLQRSLEIGRAHV